METINWQHLVVRPRRNDSMCGPSISPVGVFRAQLDTSMLVLPKSADLDRLAIYTMFPRSLSWAIWISFASYDGHLWWSDVFIVCVPCSCLVIFFFDESVR